MAADVANGFPRGASAGTVTSLAHQPNRLSIGVRLSLCFVVIVFLMVASHALTLWQFQRVRIQEERMLQLDRQSRAVIGLHADLLLLSAKLEDLQSSEDSSRFTQQAADLRAQFLDEVEKANRTLRDAPPQTHRDPTLLSTLETIQSALPSQIDALIDLANAGDWPAVRLRTKNQVVRLSSLTSQLVDKVDSEVSEERKIAEQSIKRLEARVFDLHVLAAFVVLLVAGVLGFVTTRSITRPLFALDAGTHALAAGYFQHRVAVEGTDELANLARAFNDAAERLDALYTALKHSEERFRTVIATAPVGIAVLDENSNVQIFNEKFLEVTGVNSDQATGMNLSDPKMSARRQDGSLCPTAERPSQRAIATGKPILNQVMRNSANDKWILASSWPLLRTDGSVSQVITTLTDITAERSLFEVSNRLLRIQEDEQRRIAREVHDSTSQEITALTLNLGALRASGQTFPEKAQKQIEESLVLAKRVAREIRTFSYLLHPPMLDELGLWAALRMFVQEFRERSGLKVELEIDPNLMQMTVDSKKEMTLYRFVQEALANVHRHSGSSTASVSARLTQRQIEASVKDAGRGIPAELLEQIRASKGVAAGGVGLSGMHERIALVGGMLRIESDQSGTTLTAVLPVENKMASAGRSSVPL